jgi:hypothetical protein
VSTGVAMLVALGGIGLLAVIGPAVSALISKGRR